MRRLLATNLALFVLVTCFGLLLFPTECTCGAAEPHPHVLFALPGHHHGQHTHHHNMKESGAAVVFTVPTGSLNPAVPVATLPTLIVPLVASVKRQSTVARETRSPRWLPVPELPPPRP
ncbi:hypothetical protein HRbin27_00410 [bacterium HR27]|nr:hypothetical protein HRbin27_00410 [bacterium HR27]